MSDVVAFRPKAAPTCDEPEVLHLTGQARCSKCSHEWTATAPVGTVTLECPNCKSWWGCYKNAVEPDGMVWSCHCGNQLFWLTPTGAMCRGCGLRSNRWAE